MVINDISVVYTNKAIYKSLLYDKTPIHLTNDVDLGKSLATLGDVMREIKEKAIRKEYFNINYIIQWGMKKHNLNKKNKNYVAKKAREYNASYYICLKKDKRFIPIKMINNRKVLCLEEWEHNRSIFIERIEKQKNVRDNVFFYWSSPRSFFYFFDYFFINMQEYKKERRFLKIRFNECKKIIETRPSENEKKYLIHRIIKNSKATNYIIDFLKGNIYLNKELDMKPYKNKVRLFLQFNSGYFGKDCILTQEKNTFWVFSAKQIEAIVWIRENYNELFRSNTLHNKRDTILSVAFDNLKHFLKNKESYEDCVYIENKIYRSLWL